MSEIWLLFSMLIGSVYSCRFTVMLTIVPVILPLRGFMCSRDGQHAVTLGFRALRVLAVVFITAEPTILVTVAAKVLPNASACVEWTCKRVRKYTSSQSFPKRCSNQITDLKYKENQHWISNLVTEDREPDYRRVALTRFRARIQVSTLILRLALALNRT